MGVGTQTGTRNQEPGIAAGRRRRSRPARRVRRPRRRLVRRTSARRTRTSETRRARRRGPRLAAARPAGPCRSGAPRSGWRERPRVDAREAGLEAPGDHLCAPGGRVRDLPEREQRREAGAGEPRLAVGADVLQEQVAEGHVREAVRDPGARPPRPSAARSPRSSTATGSGTTCSGSRAAAACASSSASGRRASRRGRTPR